MQELKNILDEIDDCICDWLSTPTDEFDQGYIKGLRRAKRIIYNNMNEKDINTAGDLISRQALLVDFRNTITENSDTCEWKIECDENGKDISRSVFLEQKK